jgi:hypothetical protein
MTMTVVVKVMPPECWNILCKIWGFLQSVTLRQKTHKSVRFKHWVKCILYMADIVQNEICWITFTAWISPILPVYLYVFFYATNTTKEYSGKIMSLFLKIFSWTVLQIMWLMWSISKVMNTQLYNVSWLWLWWLTLAAQYNTLLCTS